ncbi:MAG: hypothetical protein JST52_06330 [Bacteroidetes bacterium]|nr:hypothetical protein [Bacteroidota bacterium]MBS1739119.1 hypothetical protein [Bacteroidota bacterium]
MDKNMIHIDDFVKQRLAGGEEPQIPGAWQRMHDLLDKEMPEKRRRFSFFPWQKTLSTVVALALLSAVGVGGYRTFFASSSSMKSNETRLTSQNHKIVASNRSNIQNSPTFDDHTNKSTTVQNTASATKKETSYNNASHNQTEAKTSNNINQSRSSRTLETVKLKSPKASKLSTTDHSNATLVQKIEQIKTLPENQSQKPIQFEEQRLTSKSISNNSEKIPITSLVASQSTAALNTTNETTLQAKDELLNIPNATSVKEKMSSSELPNSSDNTRLTIVPKPVQQPIWHKDSIVKMDVVQRVVINHRSQMRQLIMDTISMIRIANDLASNQALSQEIVPNTSTTINDQSEQFISLAHLKVKSRKTSRWNAQSFNEAVQNVKFNLAQTRFYPGISAGGNSYISSGSNFGGFQLGIFGLFTFGETWSMMGELKYIQRFNGGKTVEDDYVNVIQKNGNNFQANVRHFFQFTSLQSIEMPIALRYAAGRLNLFCGANLAFHFKVNADERKFEPNDADYTPLTTSGKIKDRPGISLYDFRERFAVGGLAGISWEVTPAIQLDFRVTKKFWDNGFGLSTEEVSAQLYNSPSSQLSIFYRFNQRNQIPKAQ